MTVPIEPTYDSADLADSLESSILAVLRTPPIRQALYDLLRVYGITAQSAEVIRHEHDQIQALAEAMTIFHGRLIEHDKRAVQSFTNTVTILGLVQSLCNHVGDPASTIAKAAADALALLNDEADTQMGMIETEAARARALLRIAQSTARADLADAIATAQTLRAEATPQTKDTAPAPTDAQAPTTSQTLHAAAIETASAAAETATAAAETVAAAAQTVAAAVETAAADAESAVGNG